jgi:CPA1 family monovalent cation:H+ antiporter
MDFFMAAGVGVVVGLSVGVVARWALKLMKDSFSEIAVTLLSPYIAWVLAEQAHASGVLACVAGGLYLRQHFSAAVAPTTRIQARAVWDFLVFVLNGVIFILIGLQLGALREAIPSEMFVPLMLSGALVSVTAIVVRLIWVPLAAWIPRLVSPSLRARDPMPAWPSLFIIGWTGMRGIVSLAAALALPLTTAAGTPFPFRSEIILITFTVIFATLVLQGLSLPPLIRVFNLKEDGALEREEMQAREHAATAALVRLDEVANEGWPHPEHLDQMRAHYGDRVQRYTQDGTAPECTAEAIEIFRRLRHETLTAERLAVIGLRNEGVISDDVLHRLEHELDVEALQLGIGERRVSSGGDNSDRKRGGNRMR